MIPVPGLRKNRRPPLYQAGFRQAGNDFLLLSLLFTPFTATPLRDARKMQKTHFGAAIPGFLPAFASLISTKTPCGRCL